MNLLSPARAITALWGSGTELEWLNHQIITRVVVEKNVHICRIGSNSNKRIHEWPESIIITGIRFQYPFSVRPGFFGKGLFLIKFLPIEKPRARTMQFDQSNLPMVIMHIKMESLVLLVGERPKRPWFHVVARIIAWQYSVWRIEGECCRCVWFRRSQSKPHHHHQKGIGPRNVVWILNPAGRFAMSMNQQLETYAPFPYWTSIAGGQCMQKSATKLTREKRRKLWHWIGNKLNNFFSKRKLLGLWTQEKKEMKDRDSFKQDPSSRSQLNFASRIFLQQEFL